MRIVRSRYLTSQINKTWNAGYAYSWFLVPFLPSHPASSMRASLVGIQEQEEMTVDRLGNPQKQVGRSGSYAHLAVSSALYTLVDVQVRRIVTVFVDEVLSGVLFFGCFLQSAKNRCNRFFCFYRYHSNNMLSSSAIIHAGHSFLKNIFHRVIAGFCSQTIPCWNGPVLLWYRQPELS